MNSEKKHYFRMLNPKNYKLGTRIHMMIFSTALVILIAVTLIAYCIHRMTMVESTVKYLEELTYLKSSQLESKMNSLTETLVSFSTESRLIESATELKNAFPLLEEEKSDILWSDSMSVIHNTMKAYYSDVLSELAPLTKEKLLQYLPGDNRAILYQYLYHYLNSKPLGEKDKYVSSGDYDVYSRTHENYHPYLLNLRDMMKASDLFLVSPASGDVVYSSNKSIDFATNLYEGALKRSALSEAFRVAVSSNNKNVYYTDFTHYAGAFDKPVFFLSTPVFLYGELTAVLIVQFESKVFDDVLYDEYMLSTTGSLEYTVIGKDMFLRNNPRGFLCNKQEYLSDMKRRTGRKEFNTLRICEQLGDMSMHAKYPSEAKIKLLEEHTSHLKDYKGDKVLAYSKKLDIVGADLYLVTKIHRSEAFNSFINKAYLYILILLLMMAILFVLGRIFGRTISARIKELYNVLVLLYNGQKSKELDPGIHDELGDTIEACNNLRKRINDTSTFAIEMSEGNYNYEFHTMSDKDDLGNSLNILKKKMIQSRDEHDERAQEDDVRNWINTGVANFNDLLRQNNDNIKELSFSIIENLIKYLDANQGGVFLVEGDKEKNKKINLVAAYAYDRKKYNEKTVGIGEGLLGNVYLEKMPVYLKEIPEDYIEVSSGLGKSKPKCLYIMPLKIDDEVLGMIEVASLNEFEPKHIEFITKVSESIAGTFVSVRLNMQTSVLLEESNRRAEENAQQEEEMRQNLEEMQATQEELARLRGDDEKRTKDMQLIIDNTRKMLRDMLDSIPGGYVLKDQNGVVHLINKEGAEFYGIAADKIIGKTDHELLSAKVYEREHKLDTEVTKKGEQEYTEEVEIKGKQRNYKVIKKSFRIAEINQMGILTIRYPEK